MVLFSTGVSLDELKPVSPPSITRDAQDRITEIVIIYTTVTETYTITWIGVTKEIADGGFVRTIAER